MKFIRGLSACLLTLLTVQAEDSSEGDHYAKFRAVATKASGSIKLDDTSYAKLTSTPRNHTSAILLTALDPRFGCNLCNDFQPEWDMLVKSWMRGDPEGDSRVVFGTLDFLDGKQTFQSLGLQTAPVLIMYHPTAGPHAKVDPSPSRFDFSNGPQRAEGIHAWISRHLPSESPKPPIQRPINWMRFATFTTIVLGLITLGTVAWPYVWPIISNRNLWAAVSLIAILLFTSGHMFNHIRSTPYVSGDGKGGIIYFTPGFQNQLGLESQIVAAIYAVLAFATICLALKVPRMTDPKTQQIAVLIWGAVMFGMYSFLLKIFKTKNSSYPFWLPPFF
ncbi:MAG: oligosaccharyl transferase subunit ost3/OST6 [Alyxoria varia]|nr:MAG: oligosaccharyl transferase subunit ost3/OST6 [Alyxoria varia]